MDEGDTAFSVAAACLPGRLKSALAKKTISALQDVTHTVTRTYQIFPEREPAQVKTLNRKAEKLLRALTREADDTIEQLLSAKGGKGGKLDRLKMLSRERGLSVNTKYRLSQQIHKLEAKDQHKERAALEKALKMSLPQIKKKRTQEQIEAFTQVLEDPDVDPCAADLANKLRDEQFKELQQAQFKNKEGVVAVEAVLQRLETLVEQARESNDIMEIEETLNQANSAMRLAKLRDIHIDPQFVRSVETAERKRKKAEQGVQGRLDLVLAALAVSKIGNRESRGRLAELERAWTWPRDRDQATVVMQVLEAVVADMEGEMTGEDCKKQSAIKEEFGEDRLAGKVGWDPKISAGIQDKVEVTFRQHGLLEDTPELTKGKALAMAELKEFVVKFEDEMEKKEHEEALALYAKELKEQREGSEFEKVFAVENNYLDKVSETHQAQGVSISVRVYELARNQRHSLEAKGYEQALQGAMDSLEPKDIRDMNDAISVHYTTSGNGDIPAGLQSLRFKASRLLSELVFENQPSANKASHQSRHKNTNKFASAPWKIEAEKREQERKRAKEKQNEIVRKHSNRSKNQTSTAGANQSVKSIAAGALAEDPYAFDPEAAELVSPQQTERSCCADGNGCVLM
eukprot:TRINITY_DN18583_c0_g1_i1.p1 TRINITY_DN18583_c0_g1~~TRINITY_DN18583_c0_g1_i1.p1  ORF type:complete len:630 (+),score=206.19 TRINITY_DN18583_c0_g1_i1:3-1892(+)